MGGLRRTSILIVVYGSMDKSPKWELHRRYSTIPIFSSKNGLREIFVRRLQRFCQIVVRKLLSFAILLFYTDGRIIVQRLV